MANERELVIRVTGIIESGPNAQRSNVSFFQDGNYQERVFRQVEGNHPEIEHLGNWHTHHVNGYPQLSDGDVGTYRRTVNHELHNTPFFYALLVTNKNRTEDRNRRYTAKHYLVRRGDDQVYEIPEKAVEIEERTSLMWPLKAEILNGSVRPERARDVEFISEFFRSLRSFSSPKFGLYWRGGIDLADGSSIHVIVLEDASARSLNYSLAIQEPPEALRRVVAQLEHQRFPTAYAALLTAERLCNRALFHHREPAQNQSGGKV